MQKERDRAEKAQRRGRPKSPAREAPNAQEAPKALEVEGDRLTPTAIKTAGSRPCKSPKSPAGLRVQTGATAAVVAAAPGPGSSAEQLFTAWRQQLGDLLEATRALMDELVATHGGQGGDAAGRLRLPMLYPENVARWLQGVRDAPDAGADTLARTSLHVLGEIKPGESYRRQLSFGESSASESSTGPIATTGPRSESERTPAFLLARLDEAREHVRRLQVRIRETSSKVLVTGDLNAGKSTFVNALVRRTVVPSDQQPCTSCFCEVVDSRENGGREEIHALRRSTSVSAVGVTSRYRADDPTTYERYELGQLRDVVLENEGSNRYALLRVFCDEARAGRPGQPSPAPLLHNGVVDVSLIDSPGLNIDVVKTVALYSQQEEIDVVVFMVHAENQFTLSGKEFLEAAGKEKAYVFVVVNRFDQIENQARCRRDILEQLRAISPQTHGDAGQLVHFVSSRAYLRHLAGKRPLRPSHAAGAAGSSSSSGEEDTTDYVGDFERMETCLQRFIIHKRAQSKLAPARVFVERLCDDLRVLARFNAAEADARCTALELEQQVVAPRIEQMERAQAQVGALDQTIDAAVAQLAASVRADLLAFVDEIPAAAAEFEWYGVLWVATFVHDLRAYLLDLAVHRAWLAQERAREHTLQGLAQIQTLATAACVPCPALAEFAAAEFDEPRTRPTETLLLDASLSYRKHRHHSARAADADDDAGSARALQLADVLGGGGVQESLALVQAAAPSVGLIAGGVFGYRQLAQGLWSLGRSVGFLNVGKVAALVVVASGCGLLVYSLSSLPQRVSGRVQRRFRRALLAREYAEREAEFISSIAQRSLRAAAREFNAGFRHALAAGTERRSALRRQLVQSAGSLDYWRRLVNRCDELSHAASAVRLV